MNKIKIGSRIIDDAEPVYIIAEIGMNHNGDFKLAEKLIRAAADCGVDAVKFQTFKAALFFSRSISDFKERQQAELPFEWHQKLKEIANEVGVEFISTPFDEVSVDFLDKLGVNCFKVASSDLNNYPFLNYIAKKDKPIILSTGFSTLDEVKKAVDTIFKAGNSKLILLHCVAAYPTQLEDLNLRAIQTLKATFGLPVGFSDHTLAPSLAAIVATVLGSSVIEKHFTLDRELPGYDHRMSATPSDLSQLVEDVRAAEISLGLTIKKPVEKELERLQKARRSLYWKDSYPAGTVITPEILLILRPADGLEPEMLNIVCGHRLVNSVKANTLVKRQDIEWSE